MSSSLTRTTPPGPALEAAGGDPVTVRFEDPAHLAHRTVADIAVFIAALRARPGQWALLGKFSTPHVMRQAAYEIRHGTDKGFAKAFAAGGFEAEARSMLGEYRVYVRYVGETGGAA